MTPFIGPVLQWRNGRQRRRSARWPFELQTHLCGPVSGFGRRCWGNLAPPEIHEVCRLDVRILFSWRVFRCTHVGRWAGSSSRLEGGKPSPKSMMMGVALADSGCFRLASRYSSTPAPRGEPAPPYAGANENRPAHGNPVRRSVAEGVRRNQTPSAAKMTPPRCLKATTSSGIAREWGHAPAGCTRS